MLLLFVALGTGVWSHSANAQSVTTFTSLQSWQAAVANSWVFSPSLGSFTKDTYFQSTPVVLGPFSLQQNGADPTFGLFRNFIDVPPLQFSDNSGVTNAAMYTKSGVTTVQLIFNSGAFAWGANFYGAQSGELLNLVLIGSGGAVIGTVPVTVNTGFFGVVVSRSAGLKQITFESEIDNPDSSVGEGFSLENVTGAYTALPTLAPSSQIKTTASGLAYSRVTQTFNGTVTFQNITPKTISGPFHIVFHSLPAGVVLVNAAGTFNGSPYITGSVTSLAAGRSSTVNVQFSDPSNITIQTMPATYTGSF
jgi:hypothetical protein